MNNDALIQHINSNPGQTLEERNAFFRTGCLLSGPSTNGVPDNLLSTVQMLQAAFPSGISFGSADYHAVCAFFFQENWPYRAIAHALDFAFDIGYVTILNELVGIEDDEKRSAEIARIESILQPLGLELWRSEEE